MTSSSPIGFLGLVRSDIAAFAARSGRQGGFGYAVRYLSLTPGFYFGLGIRIQHAIARVPFIGRPLRRVLWFFHSLTFSSEVAPDAQIGAGFYTPHPYAIVIGEKAVIGANVTVLQGVTIGIRTQADKGIGRIEDGVFLGAGACIIGAVRVGEGAVVGANAVVIRDVPANATVVGNPARVLTKIPA